MKTKRTIGIVVLLAGIAMIFFSMYIMNEVTAGRGQISQAQRSVDRGTSLFNATPWTRGVGKGISGAAQKKINKYSAEADRYERIAGRLKIGGIILIIVGAGVLLLARKKHA